MVIELTPWLLRQVIVAQQVTPPEERDCLLFVDSEAGRPLLYSIGLSDNGRHVCIEIHCAIDLSGDALVTALPVAVGFAQKLWPPSKWKVIEIVGGLALEAQLTLDEYLAFPAQLFISKVLTEPGRQWREFLDAFQVAEV